MEAQPVVRTAPEAGLPDSNPDLVELIRDETDRRGPITFARFMELALYAPELGYYRSTPARTGRAGDFLTAPETHPIFGAAIARQVSDVWRRIGEPPTFRVREYGAGSGVLAATVILELGVEEPRLAAGLTYEAVEINPHRRDEMRRRLASNPANARLEALDPIEARSRADRSPAVGVVLANEFLDALPVHRVEVRNGALAELYVATEGAGLAEVPGPPSTPALAGRLASEGVTLEEGQRAEIALGIDDWFDEISNWLARGAVIVVDYGHAAADLYGPKRRAGALLGYAGHRIMDDPFVAIGRQDLTAHVDFTAVERAARAHGLDVLGLTTQAQFLVALGLEDLLERARSNEAQTLAEYLELRSGLARLLDPRHTGGFKVLVLGRGLSAEPPLRGLSADAAPRRRSFDR